VCAGAMSTTEKPAQHVHVDHETDIPFTGNRMAR
jgi:hypothetical protein